MPATTPRLPDLSPYRRRGRGSGMADRDLAQARSDHMPPAVARAPEAGRRPSLRRGRLRLFASGRALGDPRQAIPARQGRHSQSGGWFPWIPANILRLPGLPGSSRAHSGQVIRCDQTDSEESWQSLAPKERPLASIRHHRHLQRQPFAKRGFRHQTFKPQSPLADGKLIVVGIIVPI